MRTLKVIAAILIALALVAAEGLAMGILSVDRALSEGTIKKSIVETGVVDDVIGEALRENTVSMGGAYGELVQSVMKTDVMNDFFAAYLSSVIRSEVYGEQYEEIAEDDLMQAFSSAIDEMEKSGAIRISQEQESIIKNMIKEELPRLTQDLNSLAMQYDASRGELTNDATSANDAMKTVLSRGTQMIMLLISAALCAALIALFWKNKSGFIWCAVITGVVTACYVLLTVLGASGTLLAGGSPGDAFVLTLLSHGFKVAAIIGGVVTCIFVAAYIVWRARDRRKEEYEENIETAKRFA